MLAKPLKVAGGCRVTKTIARSCAAWRGTKAGDLTEQLGTFVEYIGITGDTPYQAYVAGGFTFSVSDDLILDCGAAEDLGVFAGFTKRF